MFFNEIFELGTNLYQQFLASGFYAWLVEIAEKYPVFMQVFIAISLAQFFNNLAKSLKRVAYKMKIKIWSKKLSKFKPFTPVQPMTTVPRKASLGHISTKNN